MIPWKTFKFRRKLQLASLVLEEKLTTYDKLVAYLHSLHVEAPSLDEYSACTEKLPTSSASSSKKAPVKKSVAGKAPNTTVEDPTEVWEAGLDGSYSNKKTAKAPAKRKTTTKRSTRSTRATKKS